MIELHLRPCSMCGNVLKAVSLTECANCHKVFCPECWGKHGKSICPRCRDKFAEWSQLN